MTLKEKLVEKIAIGIYKAGGIEFENVILNSGKPSPYYITLRTILSNRDNPTLIRDIVDAYIFLIDEGIGLSNTDLIISIPKTAMFYTGALHYATGKPIGYVDDPKGYGKNRLVEAELHEGDSIVLQDDVISTSKSKFGALEKIVKQSEIDKVHGGPAELLKYRSPIAPNGVKTNSLMTALEMIDILYKNQLITIEQRKTVSDYTLNQIKN